MKSREERIAFEMNYCQHYGRGKGADMICKAGMDIDKIKVVPVGQKQIKWGPCIEGHLLSDPNKFCPKWIRRTRENGGEKSRCNRSFYQTHDNCDASCCRVAYLDRAESCGQAGNNRMPDV